MFRMVAKSPVSALRADFLLPTLSQVGPNALRADSAGAASATEALWWMSKSGFQFQEPFTYILVLATHHKRSPEEGNFGAEPDCQGLRPTLPPELRGGGSCPQARLC